MLSENEKKFIDYWEVKRQENKLNPFFFFSGFAGGLAIGFLVIIAIGIGWYKRATMEANSMLNPVVLIVAIIAISIFIAFFYNSFKYEQNEQLYSELKKKERE